LGCEDVSEGISSCQRVIASGGEEELCAEALVCRIGSGLDGAPAGAPARVLLSIAKPDLHDPLWR
jgi:hypothetical protein